MITARRLFASGTAVLTAACALVLVPTGAASAHPLGNFTVNRYDGLVAAPGQLRILHVEDLAEIPATQAAPAIERQGTGDWARERCEKAAAGSEVTVDGNAVDVRVRSSRAEERPGQAGLKTLRVECRLTAALPDRAVDVRFHAAVDSGPGWREVTAQGDRTTLTGSDVPEESVSKRLTSYPEDLLQSPEDTATASLQVKPGGPALAEQRGDAPGASILPRGADRWTRALDDLVSSHDLTLGFGALAFGIAMFLGAMHALGPGHGKTLMAATAAARDRARMRDVLPMAASVTVTHTLGVVALGLLVLAGSAAAPSVITWLGIASGLFVMGAGVTLARRAWLNRKLTLTQAKAPGHDHTHDHDHDHTHPHGHDHEHHHDHGHSHSHGEGHSSPHDHAPEPDRELVLAAPSAAHAHTHASVAIHTRSHEHAPAETPTHSHDHGHGHDHDHPHSHDHEHDHPHSHEHPHASGQKRSLFGGGVTHTHGGFTHTHPTAPTLRGTILLGFAGGMVPSPSAVVVLVGAAALGKAWFGLLLVVAYGIGLALTLTAAGYAVVKAGGWVTRVMDRGEGRLGGPTAALVRRTVPLASALLVVALGAGLVFRGATSALG
ncbi:MULTISPECIES: nickel transporter [Streptomyces]|uniref:HoxN/HupN/NixA family nickel/cobalt transporter n=1 Tax=Streptomyces scabiei TaxID=1930 RepID=UPI001B305081|nr:MULTISPECIES: nickel transporter [Streptomyces]MBP5894672.1 nickel transporter [Streptomyces sp. LBUM 1481]MBP5924937.1 nickel transporter [Streptomyces sp. LBUM 1483]MDX2687318.1 nickel transporter [Streptomyces scabiei]MDX2751730.1 nickel transporter [Streptomyces scabiei]MDX2804779.1 nickel transporter [Streptomyces scabiei]